MRRSLLCVSLLALLVLPSTTRAQDVAPIRIDLPPASAPAAQAPVAADFQGRGQQLTAPTTLNSGLVVAELSHDGQRNFAVTLVDATGGMVELLSNAIGPVRMSKAFGIRSSGEYLMNVQADGAWTIRLRQPAAVAETDTTSFSGTGATATPLFTLAAGLRRFALTHSGSRNFAVQLLGADGSLVDLLANVIGPFDGSKGVRIRQDGVFIISVEADGPWTITSE